MNDDERDKDRYSILIIVADEMGETSVVNYYIDREYLKRVGAITRTNSDVTNLRIERGNRIDYNDTEEQDVNRNIVDKGG